MSTAERKEPGLDEHPKGGYTPGMFQHVESADDFAAVLGVPTKSIALIIPTNLKCKSKDCPFNAIEHNRGHCPAHQRSWYPLRQQRGESLLGPEFLRPLKGKMRDCHCDQRACKSAGYFPGHELLYIKQAGHETVINTPNLLPPQKKEALRKKEGGGASKLLYLYPWHFFPDHRELGTDGKWRLKYNKDTKYLDSDRFVYPFPPPRNTVKDYLEKEYFNSYIRPQDRWAIENEESKMPTWMVTMIITDGAKIKRPREKKTISQLRCEVDMWRRRALHEREEKEKQVADLTTKLSGRKRKYEDMLKESEAEIKKQRERAAKAEQKVKELEIRLSKVRETLERVRTEKASPLRYSDLYEGGVLSKHVEAFTLFDTVEQNDAFLELINYADGTEGANPEGDGLCENLRAYSTISWEERLGEIDPPSMDPDSKEYKEFLRRSKAARSSSLTWKDDYLVFCVYVRAGLTQVATCSLFGISVTRMSDIFHEWAQVLDDGLCEMFPRPTRSQILRAYPTRFIEVDGHARCGLLLDAFEVFSQALHNPNVASSTHSDYKGHDTVKFLGGTDPIGCPWCDTVPDGNPGKASDVIMTEDTQMMRQVPYGHTCKVDKGFIVDNEAGHEGVIMDRPQKRLKKQQQQSTVDTSQTQKIGNTRIIVENVNGELKLQIRYLNVLVPCVQFGIISKIVRIGYLFQNFKKAIIQRRDPRAPKPVDGRPCRAEIRWYGATDAGLTDVRGNIRLWGLKCEIDRHRELSAMEQHKNKSAIEISEIVLGENWPLRRRKKLYRDVHGIEYDGDI